MKAGACPRLFEVEALRDGRLGEPERGHFERHLAACPACSREARALEELSLALRSPPPEAHSDELHVRRERTRLLAAFDRGLLSERRPRASERRWLAAVALAALAAGILFFFWREPAAGRGVATSSAEFRAAAGTLWSRQVEAQRELVVLDRGALWIQVAAVPHKLPLLVRLPDGDLEDIGTTFSVSVEAGRTTGVVVEEGSVVLRLRGRAPVSITAGESWPAPPAARSTAPPAASPSPSPEPAAESAPPVPESAAPLAPRNARRQPSRARASGPVASAPRAESDGFRDAMAALHAGQSREAADRFARFIERHPGDARAEDAAYMRVLALRQAADDAGARAAARDYLGRYPQGFRRAEVEALLR